MRREFSRELSISRFPFVTWVTDPTKEGEMQYVMLIHQGDAPTPREPEAWAKLSEEEQQAVYADYQAINQTPGVTPGKGLDAPETATTVRVQDGKTLTTDGPFVEIKEAIGGYFLFEADGPRRRDRAGRAGPGGPPRRRGRGAPDRGVVAILDQVFRDHWGRVLAALIGFLGDFDLAEEATQEAFAIAAERWPRDGEPPNPVAWLTTTARNRAIDRIRRDRTLATKTQLLRRGGEATMRRRRRSPTSASSSSSPAATRRWRSRRRSR